MNNTEISIKEVFQNFKSHFDNEFNNRILFSGEYGIGKTFFLNKFFEKKEDYDFLVISPLNYQTSSNEDIFELIKVDIIFQLYAKGLINFEEFEFDNLSLYSWFLLSKPLLIANSLIPLLNRIDVVGDEFEGGINIVFKLYNSLTEHAKKFKDKIESKINEHDSKVVEFVEQFTSKPGSPYENNVITQFINEILSSQRSKNKCALIIDDLDRMDPDHIFRILNVLSVHNNHIGNKNKFNFDKIILVCDILNIEKIFYHKYGEKVDFHGYVDKFYSIDIYKYTNLEATEFYFNEGLKTNLDPDSELTLKLILKYALRNKVITLRQLMKHKLFDEISIENFTLLEVEYPFDVQRHNYFVRPDLKTLKLISKDLPILQVIKYLYMIWGDYDLLISNLNLIKSSQIATKSISYEEARPVIKNLILYERLKQYPNHWLFFDYQNMSGRDIYPIGWPEGNIYGLKYRLILQWNKGQNYFSEINYFNSMEIELNKHSNTHVPIKQLISSILEMITYLKEHGHLEEMDVKY